MPSGKFDPPGLQRAMDDSRNKGRDPTAWPLYDSYEVTDGLLIPLGEPNRYYIPTAYPRLPYEFAKLEYGNKDSALQFVEEWGLLGYSKLAGRGPARIGDSLEFIWGHASMVAQSLRMSKSLRDFKEGDETQLVQELDRLNDLVEAESYQYYQSKEWWRGAEKDNSHFDTFFEKDEIANSFICEVISANIGGLRPTLQRTYDDDSNIGRLKWLYRWGVLLEVVYLHLGDAVTGDKPLVECERCHNLFQQTDKRQKYCPSSEEVYGEYRRGTRSRAQSSCGLNQRQQRHRAKSRR